MFTHPLGPRTHPLSPRPSRAWRCAAQPSFFSLRSAAAPFCRGRREGKEIITTNLPVRGPVSLQSAVSERVFSRLAECTVVVLKGRDRRLGTS